MWAACLFFIDANAIVVFRNRDYLRWASTAMSMNMHWAAYHMARNDMLRPSSCDHESITSEL